jgi:hypothetical protein
MLPSSASATAGSAFRLALLILYLLEKASQIRAVLGLDALCLTRHRGKFVRGASPKLIRANLHVPLLDRLPGELDNELFAQLLSM